jgi:hypothetical protein
MVQGVFKYSDPQTAFSSVYPVKGEEESSPPLMNYVIRPTDPYGLEDYVLDPKQYTEEYIPDFMANKPHLHHMPSISTTSSFESVASADSAEYPIYDLSTGGSQDYDWTAPPFQWPPNRAVLR